MRRPAHRPFCRLLVEVLEDRSTVCDIGLTSVALLAQLAEPMIGVALAVADGGGGSSPGEQRGGCVRRREQWGTAALRVAAGASAGGGGYYRVRC